MKNYVWLSREKLNFISDHMEVLSLLYDLGLLPEEIDARVRGYVEEECASLNLQIDALTNVMREIVDEETCMCGTEKHCAIAKAKALLKLYDAKKRKDEVAQ